MRDYELMVVLDANLDESGQDAALTRINTAVTQRGGAMQSTDKWGRRRLAYPISRHRDGIYVLMRLQLQPESAVEVERTLKLMDSVIRHLLVRAPEGGSVSTPPPASFIAETPTPVAAPAPAEPAAPAAEETAAAEETPAAAEEASAAVEDVAAPAGAPA